MEFRCGSSWTARLLSLGLCVLIALGAAGPAMAATSPGGKSPLSKAPGSPSGIDTMPRLGVEGLAASSDDVLQALSEAGAGFVRVQLDWGMMEPVNSTP